MLISLLAAAQTPAAAPEPPRAKCEAGEITYAREKKPARVEPLDKQPPANLEVAVQYSENGCVKPIIVREDVGK